MLTTTAEITTIFDTDLERAFKSPMLCDVTRIHTGSFVTPKVTRGSPKIHLGKTAPFKGGEA